MYLLIGHFNKEFTNYFDANNVPYYIIKDSKSHETSSTRSMVVDFTDKNAVYEAVNSLSTPPSVVFTMYEQYIPITAEINKRLGLTHALSPESARASTDKILMRGAFAKAPEPISPPFTLVDNKEQAVRFAKDQGFPLVLKPANLSKSLLITRCNTMDELLAAWDEVCREAPRLYQKFTDGLKPRFILESFMSGSVHTVMGFADRDGNIALAQAVVDNTTAQEEGFDDSFIYSRIIPSALHERDQQALLHCAKLGMEALGLRSCAAHIELILTEKGPRIIEIGARVGGYRTVMYREANGINVVGAALTAYSGELPDLTIKKQSFYRAIEIFPSRKGTFEGVKNFQQASELKSILSARLKNKPGDTVGKASQGFKAVAIFELCGTAESQIENDYNYIRANVAALLSDSNKDS